MPELELDRMVHIAARYGAGYDSNADLVRKVRAITGPRPGLRLLAAATVFHVWLLRGRPDKETFAYRARVLYAIHVLDEFIHTPEEGRRTTTPIPASRLLN